MKARVQGISISANHGVTPENDRGRCALSGRGWWLRALRFSLTFVAWIVAMALAPVAHGQGMGSLDRLFEKVEATIRDQLGTESTSVPPGPQGAPNSSVAGQREARRGFSFSEDAGESQDNRNGPPPAPDHRKGSSLDSLMNADPRTRNTEGSVTPKASFLAEFEREYRETSDESGRVPGGKQRQDTLAGELALMLPAEFGVATQCVQQRRVDGRISGTAQAIAISAAMYDVIDQIASPGGKVGMLRDRVHAFSQPGSGCPNDFPAIKLFLNEYADFAKGMVARKKNLIADRKAMVQELADTVGRDAPKSSVTKYNSVFARIENSYKPKSEENPRPTRPSKGLDLHAISGELAEILTSEYGVSDACVLDQRGGAKQYSARTMGVANAMSNVLDSVWAKKHAPGSVDAAKLTHELDQLSRRAPYGCPADLEQIRRFLSDFSDFAKAMIDRKDAESVARTQQREEAQRRRESQDKERSAALKAGKEKPSSFRDYLLMHPYASGYQLFVTPSLRADNKVYLFDTGILDREDSGGLVVKGYNNSYIHVKSGRSTPVFGDLKMNTRIVVIGRYVDNTQYQTVMGAVKTAAVIEAIAISDTSTR